VTGASGSGGGARLNREKRLAAALKANLKRRKTSLRGEPAGSDRPDTGTDDPEPVGQDRCEPTEVAGADKEL
jgi:hypothetical protein